MSDAHALHMFMAILLVDLLGPILCLICAYVFFSMVIEPILDRRERAELEEAREEEREEQVVRETQEWLESEKRRIEQEQQRIEQEQQRIEQEQKHWQLWREFMVGETLIAPRSVYPDFGGHYFNLWDDLGIDALRKCKARGEAWTEDNLLSALKDIPANTAGSITLQALYILRTVRARLNALPMAA